MKEKYWFGFRTIFPKPAGSGIACGPYDTYEEAKLERSKAKEWDCEVSIPYTAETKEEASQKALNEMF